MTEAELDRWISVARDVAIEAGQVLMRGYRTGFAVRKKGDIDLVTEHDLASEAVITRRMREAFPDHAVIAEEGGGEPSGSTLAWYCDPLDGTTNFAHGHFVWSVAIGLAERGVPIAGVVHAPAIGITWHGARGIGAFRNGVPCRVSARATLRESIVATGFPYDRARDPDNNVAEASRIIPQVQGIRRLGSAAMDLCLVADGTYDAYWEQKLAPWDLCAGAGIAVAAGARLTTYAGDAVDVRSKQIVCTNGLVHEELRAEVLAARAQNGLGTA